MSLFVRLPDCIAIETLVLWCDLKDLGLLDSAFCCDQRQAFLDIIEHDNFVLKSEPLDRQKIISPWVKDHGIKLSFLHLDDHQLKSSLHLLNKSGVVKLNFHPQYKGNNTDKILVKIINECPNLKILEINNGFSIFNILKEVTKNILHQLTSLTITANNKTDKMSSELMAFLAENCAQIETFMTWNCTLGDSEKNLISFVARNKNLKQLYLNGTKPVKFSTETVVTLAKHVKSLEEISIMSQYGGITLSATAELFKQCRHLLYLSFKSPRNNTIEFHTRISTDKFEPSTRGIRILEAEAEEGDWTPLITLLENVASLHQIYLDDMKSVPGSVLHTIAKHHKVLETIKIGFIGTMYNGHDVAQIIQKCSELSSIHLTGCEHFSAQDFVTAFANDSITTALNNSKLYEITVKSNAQINNNEVKCMIENHYDLEMINLYECNEIDIDELNSFIQTTGRDILVRCGFQQNLEGDESDGGWGDEEDDEEDDEDELN